MFKGVVVTLLYYLYYDRLLCYLYYDRLARMRQGDTTGREKMAGEGDGHAKAVSGHKYIVLLFIVTTL
jgi:hypothetical protein